MILGRLVAVPTARSLWKVAGLTATNNAARCYANTLLLGYFTKRKATIQQFPS